MTQREELYAERDIIALDEAGNYYFKHVMAMTSEQLHSKSAIASELAHRDMLIDKLTKELQAAKAQIVPEWIPVSERMPEEHSKPYQVAATCLKKYEGGSYDGQGKKTIVQDWVIRRWPQNFAYWFELPAAPEKCK